MSETNTIFRLYVILANVILLFNLIHGILMMTETGPFTEVHYRWGQVLVGITGVVYSIEIIYICCIGISYLAFVIDNKK